MRAVAAIRRGMQTNDVASALGVEKTTVLHWHKPYMLKEIMGFTGSPVVVAQGSLKDCQREDNTDK